MYLGTPRDPGDQLDSDAADMGPSDDTVPKMIGRSDGDDTLLKQPVGPNLTDDTVPKQMIGSSGDETVLKQSV